MSLARSKNHFLPISYRAIKRFRLAVLNTLIVFVASSLFFGMGEFAAAQDIFGRIVGTITDSSGAAVPNAKVTITNEATQLARPVTVDKNGYFVADELPVGTYTVSAEHQGFKTTTKTGNVLVAGGRLTVDLRLEVGVVTDTVRVAATGDTINTTSVELSTTIDFKQMQALSLNQRHYEELVTLIPGAMVN